MIEDRRCMIGVDREREQERERVTGNNAVIIFIFMSYFMNTAKAKLFKNKTFITLTTYIAGFKRK